MGNRELTLEVRSDESIRAVSADGSIAEGHLELDDLHRQLLGLFDSWVRQKTIGKSRELKIFGSFLYRALFGGKIGQKVNEELGKAANSESRLRLQLSFEQKVGWLAPLPWEMLYCPDEAASPGFFLATHRRLVLSRYVALNIPTLPTLSPDEPPLKLVFVVSKPTGLNPVIDEPTIEAARKIEQAGRLTVEVLDKPTIENLEKTLQASKPHAIHYVGHAQFNKEDQRGEIALLDEAEAGPAWYREEIFADVFTQAEAVPRLVILQACQGGTVDFSLNFAGLAPRLLGVGVQAVVAMQYPISNYAATTFNRVIYRDLAAGLPIDDAIQNGRWRLLSQAPNASDARTWATPVLYMRSRDGLIVPPDPPASP
jgi:CHAT domain